MSRRWNEPVGWRCVLGCLLILSACAGTPEPVPVAGGSTSIRRLVGEWRGTYESPETGRSGTIRFSLEAEHDTAYGEVVMIPRGTNRPLLPVEGRMPAPRRGAEVLRIRFVLVEGDRVLGSLEPYRDPECGCTLTTRFAGRMTDGVVKGTYTSRSHVSGAEHKGRWEAEKAAP